jgi:DNA mismatch repair protein MutH
LSSAPLPPKNEAELLTRAAALAGHSLKALAEALDRRLPEDLAHHKGWVGELVEQALGATAGNRPTPDFPRLGIELKTLPVDAAGHPTESTFVTAAPLRIIGELSWADSPVRSKLARVLWIPVEADPVLPLAVRRLGSPLLWSPSPEEDRGLAVDWEELTTLVREGDFSALTAHHGRWLQVRPKGADSRARTQAYGQDGTLEATAPRGFYLRRSFTAALVAAHYHGGGGA